MNFAEYQKFVEYQKIKDKNLNKLWQKPSKKYVNKYYVSFKKEEGAW